MYWTFCVLAALSFTVGGVFMKQADGFHNVKAGIVFLLMFAIGALLQSHALRGESLAVTYVLVLGLEAALAVGFGIVLLGESVSAVKLAGLGVTVLGIALLRSL